MKSIKAGDTKMSNFKKKKTNDFKKKRSFPNEKHGFNADDETSNKVANVHKNKKSGFNDKLEHKSNTSNKKFGKNLSPFKKNKKKRNKMNNSNAEVDQGNSETSNKKRKSEDGEASPSKKPKLHEMKFKERKLMRKQKEREGFDVVKLLKTYWEDLRREDCILEKKTQLLNQICNLVKGRVKEFIFAHDTVRVLECVFADGTEEHRNLLFEEIKEDIVTLSKSKYGKFLIMKILRYGTKKHKEAVMTAFSGTVTQLMKHTVAAEVVETAFNEYANAFQRFQIIQEFYGSSYRLFKESNIHNLAELLEKKPETKQSVISSMKEELMKVLEKSVVKHSLIHHVLLQFFLNCDHASRSEVIESLREVVPEILHTKDGSRVAMHCVWFGDHKDRKVIVKHMKTFVKKIAMEEHGHMVLLSLFDCVDDTNVLEKIIIKELHENLLEISQNVHGKKVLVYLLNPRDSHFFHPDVINILKRGDNNANSKKNPEKRQQELKMAIAEPLSQLIVNNIADLYKNNAFCLFTVTILKHTVGNRRQAFESIAKLASERYTSENKNVHVIEYPGSFFMLKQLILNDTSEQAEGRNLDSVTFSEVLVNTIPDGIMKTWFNCNRGAFLLVNLLETEIPAVVNRIRTELLGSHKQLDKLNFKGAELLVTKLRKLPVNTHSE